MAKLRSISTAIWSDPFIEDCTASEKLLFLYLITNEKTNMLGVFELSNKKISFETGICIETVENALKRFETLSKVLKINDFIILSNFLKNQNFNKNMMKSAIQIYNNLPKKLKFSTLELSLENVYESFETLTLSFGKVRKVEVEVEVEYEVEVEVEVEKEKEVERERELKIKKISLPPFSLIGKELTDDLNSWELVNKSRFGNYTEMIEAFDNTSQIEIMSPIKSLQYRADMLFLRFKNFARLWLKNQKAFNDQSLGHDIIENDLIYFITQVDSTIRNIHKQEWVSFVENQLQGGYVLTQVESATSKKPVCYEK
jgi:hypothetical protein